MPGLCVLNKSVFDEVDEDIFLLLSRILGLVYRAYIKPEPN